MLKSNIKSILKLHQQLGNLMDTNYILSIITHLSYKSKLNFIN
jgi:hypothetical protein